MKAPKLKTTKSNKGGFRTPYTSAVRPASNAGRGSSRGSGRGGR